MPKGMTPKKRMGRSVMGLARAVKPSGRLNIDDIVNARSNRSKMPLSEIKKRKLMAKIRKQEPKKLNKPISSETMKKMAGMLGLSVGDIMSGKISDAKERQERIMDKGPRPMKKPARAPMEKGPNKMNKQKTPMQKALGPIRPLRERSQSKLISRRRAMKNR